MKYTANMRLNLPEGHDEFEMDRLNENFARIDKKLAEIEVQGIPVWFIKLCLSAVVYAVISKAAAVFPRAR